MKLAIWSTTTPRENSTHVEMFRRQLEEVELAEHVGIEQIWFFEHHLMKSSRTTWRFSADRRRWQRRSCVWWTSSI
ncbi:MAG TPA: LLM class flavin-dependent oxidoreductase [Acetobacteraceae bacterium]